MTYIVFPTANATEARFYRELLKKMKKETKELSASELEDSVFATALRSAARSGTGSLDKVKAGLQKVAAKK
ncbi:MAG: hypothetical protein ACKVOR_03170 [Flavobacteriales bacterium]